jgi:hypothetical protein
MTEKILHTEKVEASYGPVTFEILEQSSERRVVNILDKEGICRTHAVTWFPEKKIDDPIAEVRRRVAAGEGVGRVVKSMGLSIEKEMIITGRIESPEWVAIVLDGKEAAINIYDFWVVNEGGRELFGTILEIYPREVYRGEGNRDFGNMTEQEYFKCYRALEYMGVLKELEQSKRTGLGD